MTQIQFVGITPDALADLIDTRLNERFKNVTEHLQPKEPTKYLTRNDVAEMLQIDISSVHNWTKKGILQAHQISGRVYYKRSEVENAIVKLEN